MHVLLVQIRVKSENREEFIAATLENSRNSLMEAGVVRFDVLNDAEDANHFTLLEVYKTPQDHARHRETRHYQVWRDMVTPWMAEPRIGEKYINLFPGDESWQKYV